MDTIAKGAMSLYGNEAKAAIEAEYPK